jgi:hypothetical protein
MRIADGSIVRPEPDPDPAVPQPAFFDVHREIYDEANSILYSMTIRTLSLENGGLVDAGGVPENQGRQLWLKLTRDGIPLLKLKFYDNLLFVKRRIHRWICGPIKFGWLMQLSPPMAIRSPRMSRRWFSEKVFSIRSFGNT